MLSIDCDNDEVDNDVFVVGMVVDPVVIVASVSIRCFWCKCELFIVGDPLPFDVLKLLLLIWLRLLAEFAKQLFPNEIPFSNVSASRGVV